MCNPITNYLGTKKWVSHFKKWLFDVKNSKNMVFFVKYPLFDEEHLLCPTKIKLLLDLTPLLKGAGAGRISTGGRCERGGSRAVHERDGSGSGAERGYRRKRAGGRGEGAGRERSGEERQRGG